MNRIFWLLPLLVVYSIAPVGQAQEPGQVEAGQRETSTESPARRPKLPKDITFESALGNVVFPHRVHRKMGCQKCHHQIRAQDLVTPHEAYLSHSWVTCHDCHSESETTTTYYGCARCHHSNLENIADETLSSKVVLHKNCWKCHLSGTGAEASARCGFCHSEGQEAPESMQGNAAPEAGPGTTQVTADGELD